MFTTEELKQMLQDEDRLGNDLLQNVIKAYTNTNFFPLFFSPGVFGAIMKLKENIKDTDELLQIVYFLGCYVGATRTELRKLLK